MSLVRTALRIATRKALLGRTAAGDRVLDSQIEPLLALVSAEPLPVIVIYTDSDDLEPDMLRFFEMEGTVTLILEVALASAVRVSLPNEEGEQVAIDFPDTDEASELVLDLLEWQIKAALLDPENEWGDIWRAIAIKATAWKSQRGASVETGTRYAARQIAIELAPLVDPLPGTAPQGTWARLLAKMDADASLSVKAVSGALRAAMSGPPLDWRQRDQVEAGLPDDSIEKIGLGPFQDAATEDGDDPALTEITVDPSEDGDPDDGRTIVDGETGDFEVPEG